MPVFRVGVEHLGYTASHQFSHRECRAQAHRCEVRSVETAVLRDVSFDRPDVAPVAWRLPEKLAGYGYIYKTKGSGYIAVIVVWIRPRGIEVQHEIVALRSCLFFHLAGFARV